MTRKRERKIKEVTLILFTLSHAIRIIHIKHNNNSWKPIQTKMLQMVAWLICLSSAQSESTSSLHCVCCSAVQSKSHQLVQAPLNAHRAHEAPKPKYKLMKCVRLRIIWIFNFQFTLNIELTKSWIHSLNSWNPLLCSALYSYSLVVASQFKPITSPRSVSITKLIIRQSVLNCWTFYKWIFPSEIISQT